MREFVLLPHADWSTHWRKGPVTEHKLSRFYFHCSDGVDLVLDREGVEIEASDVLLSALRAAARLMVRCLATTIGRPGLFPFTTSGVRSWRHCPSRRIRIVATLSILRRAFSNGPHTRPHTRTRPEARGIIDAAEAGAMPVHYQRT